MGWNLKAIGQWFASSAFLAGAILCFALAVLFSIADRVDAATLMAGLFVILVLFNYLPQMEYFKAYGVEAKMRAKLNEADEILKQLKAAAVLSGKIAYHTLGWQSRMAHPVREKQALADEVDTFLRGAGVSEEEIADVKKQYIRFILFDLDHLFSSIVRRCTLAASRGAVQELSRLGNDESVPEVAGLRRRVERLNAHHTRKRRGLADEDDPVSRLNEEIPEEGLLDEGDQNAVRRFADRIVRVGKEVVAAGRLTPEAGKLIIAMSGAEQNALIEEVFGRELKG